MPESLVDRINELPWPSDWLVRREGSKVLVETRWPRLADRRMALFFLGWSALLFVLAAVGAAIRSTPGDEVQVAGWVLGGGSLSLLAVLVVFTHETWVLTRGEVTRLRTFRHQPFGERRFRAKTLEIQHLAFRSGAGSRDRLGVSERGQFFCIAERNASELLEIERVKALEPDSPLNRAGMRTADRERARRFAREQGLLLPIDGLSITELPVSRPILALASVAADVTNAKVRVTARTIADPSPD